MMFAALVRGFEVCKTWWAFDDPPPPCWDDEDGGLADEEEGPPAALLFEALLLPPPLLCSLLLLLLLPPGMKERRFSAGVVDIRPSFLSFVMGTAGDEHATGLVLHDGEVRR